MNKERFERVMSGLNQYVLIKAEDQFVKTALEDFDKNQFLTEHREKRLENLYKERSKLIPNKNQVSSKGCSPKKTKPHKARWKAVF